MTVQQQPTPLFFETPKAAPHPLRATSALAGLVTVIPPTRAQRVKAFAKAHWRLAIVAWLVYETVPALVIAITFARAFLRDRTGASAIEYALIASAVALAIVAIVDGLGLNLNAQFNALMTSLQ